MQSFAEFFLAATGFSALQYQLRFAADPAVFRALSVPTGLGKTDAVLVDWMYRTPTTRLVIVEPGRALTAQLREVVRDRLRRAGKAESIRVVELMGNSDDLQEVLRPEERAILIGTQDLLISAALNRRYVRSPFRWPIDFALLNNDTAWVFDEVQLLGDSLASSTQLAAFRKQFGAFGSTPCVWLSATFNPEWLRTFDFHEAVSITELTQEDESEDVVRERVHAPKTLLAAPKGCRLPKGCAEFVRGEHQPGTRTLVVTNTVGRAREIWAELRDLQPVLLHSRFRAPDRDEQMNLFLKEEGGIAVTTQVIEAGIDVDANLMVTDIAPWPSLVQRFGRVNRRGKSNDSRIFWVDRPLTAKRKSWAGAATLAEKEQAEVCLPYEVEEIDRAEVMLHVRESASIAALRPKGGELPFPDVPWSFVVRRADLLDLFDTTPDLTGNQLDISRFVRSGKETDVYVAWREWDKDQSPPRKPALTDEELCAVPIHEAKALLKRARGWIWSFAERGCWMAAEADSLFPSARVLFRSSAGAYTVGGGWQPESRALVPPVRLLKEEQQAAQEVAYEDDRESLGQRPQTIAEHTADVMRELEHLLDVLRRIGVGEFADALRAAARKHDIGKAHRVFQETVGGDLNAGVFLAKSGGNISGGHKRPWFRHELASALAMAAQGESDLACYVAAAHHGKVRLNIRSMPGETALNQVRGIKDGELLPAIPEMDVDGWVVSTALTRLGGWTERVLRLLDELGPFRLAYLEMLLRAADAEASRKAQSNKRAVE